MFKRIKSYLRIITTSLILSAIFVYVTCLFNEVSISQVFMVRETKIWAWFAVGGNVYLIATCALVIVMNLLPIPEIPGGPWEEEQLIVCRYSEMGYSAVGLFCVGFGLFMLYGAFMNVLHAGDDYNAMQLGIVLGMMGPVFIALGSVFILFMKNYMMVIYPEGVFFQNLLGKTYVAKHDQINFVVVTDTYRHRQFLIRTDDKILGINSYCSNYFEAMRYVVDRYPDYETYQKQQNGE